MSNRSIQGVSPFICNPKSENSPNTDSSFYMCFRLLPVTTFVSNISCCFPFRRKRDPPGQPIALLYIPVWKIFRLSYFRSANFGVLSCHRQYAYVSNTFVYQSHPHLGPWHLISYNKLFFRVYIQSDAVNHFLLR